MEQTKKTLIKNQLSVIKRFFFEILINLTTLLDSPYVICGVILEGSKVRFFEIV